MPKKAVKKTKKVKPWWERKKEEEEEEYINIRVRGQGFRVRKELEGTFTPEDEELLRKLHGEEPVYEGPIRSKEAVYAQEKRRNMYAELTPEEREYLNRQHGDPHYVDKKIKEEEEKLKKLKEKQKK